MTEVSLKRKRAATDDDDDDGTFCSSGPRKWNRSLRTPQQATPSMHEATWRSDVGHGNITS
jgi:hypothetical protein